MFSAFQGGFHVLAGKTGGYLWGFLPMAALCGLAHLGKGKALPYLWGLPGLMMCHLCGTLQNMLLAEGGFWALLMVYSVPYLLKDALGLVAAALLVYLLRGAVGAPVFSAFQGGFHVLAGKTGGYLWGFLPMAALCGLARLGKGRALPYLWGLPGLMMCHLCGTLQNMFLAGGGFWALLMVYSVPYLLKDALGLVAAALLAHRLRPVLKKYLK